MWAIEIENLTQDYTVGFWRKRTVRALDGVSLQVGRGEVFGFLGPNGAGKTTAFKVLLRLLYPTAGAARILGCPLDDLAMRARIGYLPEQPYFYDYLTAREFLRYCGKLFELSTPVAAERSAQLLAQVGLAADADKHLRKFSKGMLQRLGLAQALINDPEVLFLDEPMSGLDPLGRREVRELMEGWRAQGKTVFFSTHILSDAETLCDRVAILKRGQVIEAGKLAEILQRRSRAFEIVVREVPEAALTAFRELAVELKQTPAGVRLQAASEAEIERLLVLLRQHGGQLVSVNPVRESLEDLFVREVGPAISAG
jgi:ABC-2 type transport system ATP-binding protein